MFAVCLAVLATLAGCGGGNAQSEGSPSASRGGGAGEADLNRNWGPAEMPDQEAQPLEFLYWRVDRMFEEIDADVDGRISADEYTGDAFNFQRMDSNGDGFMTKKEIIDDFIPVLRQQGAIP